MKEPVKLTPEQRQLVEDNLRLVYFVVNRLWWRLKGRGAGRLRSMNFPPPQEDGRCSCGLTVWSNIPCVVCGGYTAERLREILLRGKASTVLVLVGNGAQGESATAKK